MIRRSLCDVTPRLTDPNELRELEPVELVEPRLSPR